MTERRRSERGSVGGRTEGRIKEGRQVGTGTWEHWELTDVRRRRGVGENGRCSDSRVASCHGSNVWN